MLFQQTTQTLTSAFIYLASMQILLSLLCPSNFVSWWFSTILNHQILRNQQIYEVYQCILEPNWIALWLSWIESSFYKSAYWVNRDFLSLFSVFNSASIRHLEKAPSPHTLMHKTNKKYQTQPQNKNIILNITVYFQVWFYYLSALFQGILLL